MWSVARIVVTILYSRAMSASTAAVQNLACEVHHRALCAGHRSELNCIGMSTHPRFPRGLIVILVPAVLAVVAGCEQRGPFVYVLESPQSVVLTASASASSVKQGETVVLHVERRTSGQWKRVARGDLAPGQCWVYRPPVEIEPEVAHSIQWEVVPEGAVAFHTEYQLDQTRAATMIAKGRVKLTPISTVKCEDDRSVAGPSIEIDVS
jgi:hypothetical protein